MQHCYVYKGHKILYCLRSDKSGWHIFLEIPGEPMRHIGPDDLNSLQEAYDHIDAAEEAGLDRLVADLNGLGEYRPV